MIRLAIILLLLSGAAARAEFSLADMVGTWAGSGVYKENLSQAKVRCQLAVTGGAGKVTVSGRCGSSLGAETIVLDFTRQGDGRIVVTEGPGAPRNDSQIEALVGRQVNLKLWVRVTKDWRERPTALADFGLLSKGPQQLVDGTGE